MGGTIVGAIVRLFVRERRLAIAFGLFHPGRTVRTGLIRHAASSRVCFQTAYRCDTVALVSDPAAAAIVFDDVHYSRPPAGRVLNGIDLTISAGSVIALVGRSGAGKSTMLRL